MATLTDEEIYNLLKDLPDFDRFPLPKYFYEKFNIAPPKILNLSEALRLHYHTANAPGPLVKTETRQLAPGGVRPLLEAPAIPIEVKQGVSIEDAIETPVNQTSDQPVQIQSDVSK
jgi:hypothetical protein